MFLSVIGSVKVFLSLICWALSLPFILSVTDIEAVADAALIIFIGILLLSVMRLRLQSVIILLTLLLIGWLILPSLPSVDQLRRRCPCADFCLSAADPCQGNSADDAFSDGDTTPAWPAPQDICFWSGWCHVLVV